MGCRRRRKQFSKEQALNDLSSFSHELSAARAPGLWSSPGDAGVLVGWEAKMGSNCAAGSVDSWKAGKLHELHKRLPYIEKEKGTSLC